MTGKSLFVRMDCHANEYKSEGSDLHRVQMASSKSRFDRTGRLEIETADFANGFGDCSVFTFCDATQQKSSKMSVATLFDDWLEHAAHQRVWALILIVYLLHLSHQFPPQLLPSDHHLCSSIDSAHHPAGHKQ